MDSESPQQLWFEMYERGLRPAGDMNGLWVDDDGDWSFLFLSKRTNFDDPPDPQLKPRRLCLQHYQWAKL